MEDHLDTDEQTTTNRRSKRSSRLSALKSKSIVENKKEEEPVPALQEEAEKEIEIEDPPEIYQQGDIIWLRVVGSPWWPALIYGCYYEDYLHTKVFKLGRRSKRRVYFVYFFGPQFEFTWTNSNLPLPYHGLEEFIRQAETAVEKATTKSEQEALANRYEMRVSANKRAQWDIAIEQADEALKLPHEQRIANFESILKTILDEAEKKNSSKKRNSSISARHSRKTSSSSSDKPTSRPSVKRQKTKSTSLSMSTSLLRVGLPTLTVHDEKRIISCLLEHPNSENLTLDDARSAACQLVTEIIQENSHVEMSCVQTEWFYDFLIHSPEVILKYAHWFHGEMESSIKDSIYIKQRQVKQILERLSR